MVVTMGRSSGGGLGVLTFNVCNDLLCNDLCM